MVEDTSSENNIESTKNRGVNVTSDCFSNGFSSTNPPPQTEGISLKEVRNEVQAVIELMGPNTPHFNYNTSSEADNEESIFSSLSGITSLQLKHFKKKMEPIISTATETTAKLISPYISPRDCTDATVDEILEQKELSLPVEQTCPYAFHRSPFVPPPPPVCVNPNCICVHSMGYVHQMPPNYGHVSRKNEYEEKKKYFGTLSKLFKKPKKEDKETGEFYKINIVQTNDEHSPPRRLVFDLVDGVPKPETTTVGINTIKTGMNNLNACNKDTCSILNNKSANNMMQAGTSVNETVLVPQGKTFIKRTRNYYSNEDATRVDIYYFDHGNFSYFRTTDSPPLIMTEILAEKTENYTTKFWAELFGTLHIGFAFFTSFILQFLRFLLYGLIRPLTVGVIQLMSDYFFKPLLTVLFNAIIQPPLIFFYNIVTTLKDLCDPIAEAIGFFFREFAIVLQAIRLIEVKSGPQCINCEKQKRKNDKGFKSEHGCTKCVGLH